MRFKKKPLIVDAFLYGRDDFPVWFQNALIKNICYFTGRGIPSNLGVKTPEGEMTAEFAKHYIIRGVQNEIYCCKADIFEESYEPVKYEPITLENSK